jgi:hypothetical protein
MKPTINKGLGALTPETWGEIYSAVQATGATDRTGSDYSKREKRFPARITGNLIFASGRARWKYSWEEVRRASKISVTLSLPSNYKSGSTSTDFAVNLLEIGNTSGLAYGYAHDGTLELDNADGFYFAPVPNGVIVEMVMRRASDGGLAYEFCAPNPITGTCPAGLVQELDGGEYGVS